MSKNILVFVKDHTLTIVVDLTKTFGKSKTGKSTTVALSEGFLTVENHPGIAFSLNVNKK